MNQTLLLAAASILGGAIASISGFGIGSVLTPALSVYVDTKLAVAAVSIPHFIGTVIRLWRLRAHVDRSIILSFGIASAAGGLSGALLNSYANAPVLGYVLGVLLIFAGTMGITGVAARMKIGGSGKWIAGVLSGVFGGLVGNQGGIRSAAMLAFPLPRESFVATATAIALLVDLARMPVYLVTQYQRLSAVLPAIGVSAAGVVIGTLAGTRLLGRIPQHQFRRIVGALILSLGIFMCFQAGK